MATLEKAPTNGNGTKEYVEPLGSLMSWRRMMDSFFDTMTPPALFGTFDLQPRANVYEKDGSYTIECGLPGYKRDDVTVEVKGNEVTIAGRAAEEKADEKKSYRRREMRQSSFTRTIAFPEDINHDNVAATLENGVLKVVVQPLKPVAGKKIPVLGG